MSSHVRTSASRSPKNAAFLKTQFAASERELRFFTDALRALIASREPKAVLRTIIHKARSMVRCRAWTLFLIDPVTHELVFEMVGGPKAGRLKGLRIRSGHGIAGWVASHGRSALVTNTRMDRRFIKDVDQATGFKTQSILCVPILSRRKPVAVLQLLNKIGSPFDRQDLRLVTQLAGIASIALERASLIEQVSNLAITDELTTLFNNRYLEQALEWELRRCQRYGSAIALIFLDLDHFKEINAIHGHPAGSACLTELAEIMRGSVRDVDILVRYGGDEFVVILPETTVMTARAVAERLRLSVRGHVFLHQSRKTVHLTASIGIAGFPDHAKTKQDLIAKADEAMYRSKAEGGDRICIADQP